MTRRPTDNVPCPDLSDLSCLCGHFDRGCYGCEETLRRMDAYNQARLERMTPEQRVRAFEAVMPIPREVLK